MTGYVRAYKPEMKIRDYEIYRGIYCSLCKNLGKRYSPVSQLLLSYDFTFLALMQMAISNTAANFTPGRCAYNPMKKCLKCSEKTVLNKCADATVIISYYKLKDNFSDKGLKKKLLSVLLYPFVTLMHKKAKKASPLLEEAVSRSMKEQAETERKENVSIDMAAHPSAQALSEILSLGNETDERLESIRRLGYMTGRWVYIMDAADDIEDDIKKGNFNPFAKEYESLKTEDEKNVFLNKVRGMLNLTLSEAAEAYESINVERYKEILNNIIYDGFASSQESVTAK